MSSCSALRDQALERRDRVAVLVLEIEDLAVRLDRRGDLVEVGLAQLREANEQRDLLVRLLDERELAADVVAEVAPRLALRRTADRARAAPSGHRAPGRGSRCRSRSPRRARSSISSWIEAMRNRKSRRSSGSFAMSTRRR